MLNSESLKERSDKDDNVRDDHEEGSDDNDEESNNIEHNSINEDDDSGGNDADSEEEDNDIDEEMIENKNKNNSNNEETDDSDFEIVVGFHGNALDSESKPSKLPLQKARRKPPKKTPQRPKKDKAVTTSSKKATGKNKKNKKLTKKEVTLVRQTRESVNFKTYDETISPIMAIVEHGFGPKDKLAGRGARRVSIKPLYVKNDLRVDAALNRVCPSLTELLRRQVGVIVDMQKDVNDTDILYEEDLQARARNALYTYVVEPFVQGLRSALVTDKNVELLQKRKPYLFRQLILNSLHEIGSLCLRYVCLCFRVVSG